MPKRQGKGKGKNAGKVPPSDHEYKWHAFQLVARFDNPGRRAQRGLRSTDRKRTSTEPACGILTANRALPSGRPSAERATLLSTLRSEQSNTNLRVSVGLTVSNPTWKYGQGAKVVLDSAVPSNVVLDAAVPFYQDEHADADAGVHAGCE